MAFSNSKVTVLLIVLANTYFLKCEEVSEIVTRQEWGARIPKDRVPTGIAGLVVIHHTYIPKACFTRDQCTQAMRSMQDFHMDTRGWSDIGYNFAIGGDAIYEGRGWQVVGAHAKGHNNNSLGIAFIGDYTDSVPSIDMILSCLDMIQYGLSNRYIHPNYQLVGHREVGNTECPGDALYTVIQSWDHWVLKPSDISNANSSSTNLIRSGFIVYIYITLNNLY